MTAKAGVGSGGFSTSAAFFDYDHDGELDLFVANYVEWTLEKDLYCTLDGKTKSYCTPESYKGQSADPLPQPRRRHVRGRDEEGGPRRTPTSKALGVSLLDYDGDGWLDLFVANDTQPNKLYRNGGNGTFKDVGMTAGVAFSETGVARAGMGVDAGDYDGSGPAQPRHRQLLERDDGAVPQRGERPLHRRGARRRHRQDLARCRLTFACFFFDYDLDGRLDIFAANGHVSDDIETVQPKVKYAQPPHLFRNLGGKRFERGHGRRGRAPLGGRSSAAAPPTATTTTTATSTCVVTANNGPARLLRNDGGNRNQWLRVRTVGTEGEPRRHRRARDGHDAGREASSGRS